MLTRLHVRKPGLPKSSHQPNAKHPRPHDVWARKQRSFSRYGQVFSCMRKKRVWEHFLWRLMSPAGSPDAVCSESKSCKSSISVLLGDIRLSKSWRCSPAITASLHLLVIWQTSVPELVFGNEPQAGNHGFKCRLYVLFRSVGERAP